MTDEIRRDRSIGNDGNLEDERDRSTTGSEPGRESSPLGTDPQEASPLPGDPREVQEPQEPRSTHIGHAGRHDNAPDRDHDPQRGVVDQLKEAWDRMRGK